MAAASPLPRFGSPETFPTKTRDEEEEDERAYRRHWLAAAGLLESNKYLGLRQFAGFWFYEPSVPALLATREHFAVRPTDVILASFPKCGTTWTKALLFSVADRHGDHHPRHPLLAANPHDCVPFFEELYMWYKNPDMGFLPPPRLLSTYLPFSVLLESVSTSACLLIYICRDPKDALVSRWHFWAGIVGPHREGITLDALLDIFCTGANPFCPIPEHILGYWREHQRRPEGVMFLKYEDAKRDPPTAARGLVAFLGRAFSEEEERDGVVGDVVRLCSPEC